MGGVVRSARSDSEKDFAEAQEVTNKAIACVQGLAGFTGCDRWLDADATGAVDE